MRRRIGRFIVAVVVLCGGAALALWRLSLSAPSWYNPPDAHDKSVAALAGAVEYHIVEQAQKIRPIENRWVVRISEEQVNAWLAARLRKWVEHRAESDWPDRFGTPQAHFEPQRVSLAIPIEHDRRVRTLVIRFRPLFDGGRLSLDLERVAVGRIELPGEPVANMLEELANAAPEAFEDPQWRDAVDTIAQRRMVDPVFELSDGRRIRVLGLRVAKGSIDLTAVTLDDGH